MPTEQLNELSGRLRVKDKTDKLREKYDYGFASIRPPDYQMLIDVRDLKWMIECIERLNK